MMDTLILANTIFTHRFLRNVCLPTADCLSYLYQLRVCCQSIINSSCACVCVCVCIRHPAKVFVYITIKESKRTKITAIDTEKARQAKTQQVQSQKTKQKVAKKQQQNQEKGDKKCLTLAARHFVDILCATWFLGVSKSVVCLCGVVVVVIYSYA